MHRLAAINPVFLVWATSAPQGGETPS